MPRLLNKAQAGIENMASYMWALLVIVSIVFVLWALGIFDTTQRVTISSGFSKIKPADPSVVMGRGGDFSVTFISGAHPTATITNLSIVNDGEGTPRECILISDLPITPASKAKFDIKAWNCTSLEHEIGEFYFLNVSMEYTEDVVGTDVKTREKGTIRGYYEDFIFASVSIQGYPTGDIPRSGIAMCE